MKRALRVSVVVVALIFVAGFAARRYLTSRQVADKVTAQLESVYGGEVKVAAVDIGLRSSSLTRFEFFEKEGSAATLPWLTVASLDTDISLFDLVNGEAVPGKIRINGATIFLRFDSDGRLLTSLPDRLFQGSKSTEAGITGPLPQIKLEQSQITFTKEGAPDLSLQNIHGTLAKDNDHWNLSLAGENPQWGRWTLSSQLTQGSPLVRVDIKSEGSVHLDQAMLLQTPFVPAAVWREVQISQATIDALVSLTYDLGKKELHYQVKLNPEATNLTVSAVALSATNARGHIVIDDNNHVQLQDVRGTVFDGTLRTDADLDFSSAAARLHFRRIDVEKLDVSRLPPSWDFPGQITGRLTGGASLTVSYTAGNAVTPSGIADMLGTLGLHSGAIPAHLAALRLAEPSQSKMHTEGLGKGEITEAKVAGQPTAAPITLELRAVPGGFRFGSNDQEGRKGVQPSMITPPSPPFVRGGEETRTIVALLVPFLQAGREKAEDDPSKKGPSYLDINLRMKDVDWEPNCRGLRTSNWPMARSWAWCSRNGICP